MTVATSQAMQTATEASSVASKVSRVARFDPVKLVQKVGAKVHHLRLARPGHRKRSRFRRLTRACLLSRRTTRFCTNTITTATSVTVTTTATAVTIDNLSSCCHVNRNRLQSPRTRATDATAEEPINPIDNIIYHLHAPRNSLQTPRT
jgi:hypothetical protein